MSSDTFADDLLHKAGNASKSDESFWVYYDPDGDCIEFLSSRDSYFAERIDSVVTVYYSRENQEIIGSLIKGVKSLVQRFLKQAPGFAIEIEDGKIKLQHVFSARLWSAKTPSKKTVLTYKKLREVASDATVDVDDGLALACD